MNYLRRYGFILVLCLLVVASLFWVYTQQQKTRSFSLDIVNQTTVEVARVELFGTSLEQSISLEKIAPGQQLVLEAELMNTGSLRIAIEQGGNQIDMHIVEDTRLLEHWQQRLTIEPGSRFLLSVIDQAADNELTQPE